MVGCPDERVLPEEDHSRCVFFRVLLVFEVIYVATVSTKPFDFVFQHSGTCSFSGAINNSSIFNIPPAFYVLNSKFQIPKFYSLMVAVARLEACN